MKETLVVTFSGGKTSAYMCWVLIKYFSHLYNFVFIFANTGQEHEKTLEFVDKVDKWLGLDLVWVEAVIHSERKSSTSKIVDFESADRSGRVFEEMILQYGIPNKAYPHCNRELKLNPIHHWAKQNLGEYITAIGIRCDELHRVSANADKAHSNGIVYPLVDWKMTDKIDVNDFWKEQDFGLEIPSHYGNCKTCWKKSKRKLFTIISEHPEWFEFFDRMEKQHGDKGAKEEGWPDRVFFRENKSYQQLLAEWEVSNFVRFRDDPMTQQKLFGYDMDKDDGCTEECIPY